MSTHLDQPGIGTAPQGGPTAARTCKAALSGETLDDAKKGTRDAQARPVATPSSVKSHQTRCGICGLMSGH